MVAILSSTFLLVLSLLLASTSPTHQNPTTPLPKIPTTQTTEQFGTQTTLNPAPTTIRIVPKAPIIAANDCQDSSSCHNGTEFCFEGYCKCLFGFVRERWGPFTDDINEGSIFLFPLFWGQKPLAIWKIGMNGDNIPGICERSQNIDFLTILIHISLSLPLSTSASTQNVNS